MPSRTFEFGVPGLGVRELFQGWVQRISVVDESESLDAGRVELPVSDESAVRAPAKRIPDEELLFVDPVGRSVDEVSTPVRRQARDAAICNIFNIEIL